MVDSTLCPLCIIILIHGDSSLRSTLRDVIVPGTSCSRIWSCWSLGCSLTLHLTWCNCSQLLKWIALFSPQPEHWLLLIFIYQILLTVWRQSRISNLKNRWPSICSENKKKKRIFSFVSPRKLEWLAHSYIDWGMVQRKTRPGPDLLVSAHNYPGLGSWWFDVLQCSFVGHLWVCKYCRQVDKICWEMNHRCIKILQVIWESCFKNAPNSHF